MKCDYCMQDHSSERYTNNQCPTCGAQKPWKQESPLQNNIYPGAVWVSDTVKDSIRAQQQNIQNAYGRGLQNQTDVNAAWMDMTRSLYYTIGR